MSVKVDQISNQAISKSQQVFDTMKAKSESLQALFVELEKVAALFEDKRDQLAALKEQRRLKQGQQKGIEQNKNGSYPQAYHDLQAELDNFDDLLGSLQQEIADLAQTLEKIADDIQKLEQELQKLQNSDLPNAQRQDAKKAQKELEQLREGLNAIAATDQPEDQDLRSLQKKIEDLKSLVTDDTTPDVVKMALFQTTDKNAIQASFANVTGALQSLLSSSAQHHRNNVGALNLSSSQSHLEKSVRNAGLTATTQPSNGNTIATLAPRHQAGLDNMSMSIKSKVGNPGSTAGSSSSVQRQWADLVSQMATDGYLDVNALVQHVLRESYQQNTEDLRFYAEKVSYFNNLKQSLRDELSRAREELAKHAGAADDAAVNYAGKDVTLDPVVIEGQATVPEWADKDITTKEELETYIENLETQLNSVGDDAQLANVDLQNMLQKQQQTLQALSNVSKMLHDTAMAIIRKIGA